MSTLRTTAALAVLFARRRDGDRLAAALPLVSFALLTGLLLVVLGGSQVFFRMEGDLAASYQLLAVLALTLLIVPLFTLSASAAKLSARRRDDRLSSLRLLGATTATVSLLTVTEAAGVALAGAVAGTVLYAALVPVVGLLHFAGQPIGGEMWLPWYWFPAAWAAVTLTAAGASAVGLRSVTVTPLGVRTRQRPGLARGRRAVLAVVLLAVAVGAFPSLQLLGPDVGVVAVVAALAATFGLGLLALDVVGPWYLRLRARGLQRRAETVARLLSARMILEDPKAAWRQVAGVSVTTFVGLVAGSGLALVSGASNTGVGEQERWLLDDMRTGVLVTVVVSFLMVACTVAINQAAATLDRARVHVALDRLGVPRDVLAEASRRSVTSSLWTVMAGSAAASALLVVPLLGTAAVLNPVAVAVLVAVFVAGYALVRVGASVAGGLVPGILARPERVL